MNKLNELKTTIQHLINQDFPINFESQRLFSEDERTFKFELAQNIRNLKIQLSKETLHEKDSKSTFRMLNSQFQKVQEVKAANANLGDADNIGFVSDNRNTHSLENVYSKTGNDQSLGKQSSTSENESTRSRNECSERSSYGNDTNIRPS
ncbi:hypothetical protein Tco_1150705 [Tanacetum coccineum]